MSEIQKALWKKLKAAIILRHGTLEVAARRLHCSVNGLRAASVGKCPGILQKLHDAGILSSPSDAPPKEPDNS